MTVLKRLERGWKGIWIRILCRIFHAVPAGPKLDLEAPLRVLFLRQDRIGDAIVSSGIFRALRSASPDLVLDVVASPANAPILRRDPSVRRVHLFDKRASGSFRALVRRLRAERYDVVIDCMVTAPSMTGLLLMLASGARQRIGIGGRGIDRALTYAVRPDPDAEHIIDRMACFARPFGIERPDRDWRPRLALSEPERELGAAAWEGVGGDPGPRVLVNLSAGNPDREWPDERTIEAVRTLRAAVPHARIAIISAPHEPSRAHSVAASAGAVAIETPELVDLIALIALADCVFTPDTSVGHIASSFEVPVLAMFRSPESAHQWGRYRAPGVDLVSSGSTVADLPLQEVLPALDHLLESALRRAELRSTRPGRDALSPLPKRAHAGGGSRAGEAV